MLKIESLFVGRCAVDHLPNKRDVAGMHPVEHDFDRDPGSGVILKYSVALLGPEDFSARDVPAKTAGVAEPLRLRQIDLADLQRGVKFFEIPQLVFQLGARSPKGLGRISL